MNLHNKQVKRMLSISFDDFLQNKIGSFQTIKWEDKYIKGRDPHPYPRCLKKKNKEPVTGMIFANPEWVQKHKKPENGRQSPFAKQF